MAKKVKLRRRPAKKEPESDIRYFAPEPVGKVDKDVTTFLLEESPDEGRPQRPSREELLEEPQRPSRDLTNWYVGATMAVLLIVIITYYVNLQAAEPGAPAMVKPVEAPEEIRAEVPAAATPPAPNVTLQDFALNTTGLKPVESFEELDDNKADLINGCNDSAKCKAALKGYQKIGLRTESRSYTIRIDKDGRIVGLREELEASTNFVIDASQEDLVALYNALAINDEETALIKLQKILPPEFMADVLQGMMAG